MAASQKTTSQANKPVTLVPVDGKPEYFKLVDLPDLFPVLPASAATLLRDITVEEAVSLFCKFVGKNLTEDLVIRILEAYVPTKIQLRQEEVWASQFQRNKACIGTQRMHRLDAGHSDYKFMCKACGTGWPAVLGLPRQGVRPLPGTLGHLRGGWHHLQPALDLDPTAGRGKPGCRWPRWYPGSGRPQLGGRHGLGESPSKNGLG